MTQRLHPRAIDPTSAADGDVLTYDAAANAYQPAAPASGGGGGGASPTSVWLAAGELGPQGGSPAFATANGTTAWLLDAATSEGLAGSVLLPSDWVTFNWSVYWSPTTTGAGGVHFDVGRDFVTPGVTHSSTYYALGAGGNSTAPGIAWRVVERSLQAGVPNQANPLGVRFSRITADAADTYAADAAIFGFMFTKAS